MNLLLEDVETLLPYSTPWETSGGCSELATVTFLRGALLGSYGFIETQLNELAIRSSRIPIYHDLMPRFSKQLNNRLDYLCKAFSSEGPLKREEKRGLNLIEKFRSLQSDRNKWAHGRLTVLPGSTANRWDGATITLSNYNPTTTGFRLTEEKFTHQEITAKVIKVRKLALASNRIHCSVTQSLPEL
jgi:hypothetical protein